MKKNSSLSLRKFLFLAGILCGGFLLRTYALGSESVWYDEASLIWRATRSIPDVFEYFFAWDTFPPLYKNFLRIWINFWGENIVALRISSVLYGTFSLFLIYCVARRLYGEKTGILSAFLLAISPFHIFYSQEIGAFVFATFLTLLTALFFLRIVQDGHLWRDYIYFSLCAFLLLNAHFYGFFILAFLNIFFIFKIRRYRLRWILVNIGVVFPCLPYLVFTFCNFDRIKGILSWMNMEGGIRQHTLLNLWKTFVYGGQHYGWGGEDFLMDFSSLILPHYLIFIFFIIGGFGLLSSLKPAGSISVPDDCESQKKRKKSLFTDPGSVFFLILWLMFPIVTAYGFSILVFPIHTIRHFLIVLPAFDILIARGIYGIKNSRLFVGILLCIMLLMIPALNQIYHRQTKMPWKAVSGYLIDQHLSSGDRIVVFPDNQVRSLWYNFNEKARKEIKTRTLGFEKLYTLLEAISFEFASEEDLKQEIGGNWRLYSDLDRWLSPVKQEALHSFIRELHPDVYDTDRTASLRNFLEKYHFETAGNILIPRKIYVIYTSWAQNHDFLAYFDSHFTRVEKKDFGRIKVIVYVLLNSDGRKK